MASAISANYEGTRFVAFGIVMVAMPVFNYVFFKAWVYRRDAIK